MSQFVYYSDLTALRLTVEFTVSPDIEDDADEGYTEERKIVVMAPPNTPMLKLVEEVDWVLQESIEDGSSEVEGATSADITQIEVFSNQNDTSTMLFMVKDEDAVPEGAAEPQPFSDPEDEDGDEDLDGD